MKAISYPKEKWKFLDFKSVGNFAEVNKTSLFVM